MNENYLHVYEIKYYFEYKFKQTNSTNKEDFRAKLKFYSVISFMFVKQPKMLKTYSQLVMFKNSCEGWFYSYARKKREKFHL